MKLSRKGSSGALASLTFGGSSILDASGNHFSDLLVVPFQRSLPFAEIKHVARLPSQLQPKTRGHKLEGEPVWWPEEGFFILHFSFCPGKF